MAKKRSLKKSKKTKEIIDKMFVLIVFWHEAAATAAAC